MGGTLVLAISALGVEGRWATLSSSERELHKIKNA